MLGATKCLGLFGDRIALELRTVLYDDSGGLALRVAVDYPNLVHVWTVPDTCHIVGMALGIL